MKQTAVILEGGATRGVFTSGVLDYFMEQNFYQPYVVGVSAGACNAVDYVSRQIGRTRDCMIHRDKKYAYMGVKNLVRQRSLFDMDMIFDKYPNKYFPFDYPVYFQSEMKCEMVVTNCQSGKAEYLDERQDKKRLMDICRASSSMPLVSPMVDINGIPYLDGGLADSVPIKRALELGYEKNIVILTRNKGYRKKTSKKAEQLYRAAYKKYPELIRTMCSRPEVYNESLEYVEKLEREGSIYVIRPTIPEVSRTERDYDTKYAFYQHGYDYAKEHFVEILEYVKEAG